MSLAKKLFLATNLIWKLFREQIYEITSLDFVLFSQFEHSLGYGPCITQMSKYLSKFANKFQTLEVLKPFAIGREFLHENSYYGKYGLTL